MEADDDCLPHTNGDGVGSAGPVLVALAAVAGVVTLGIVETVSTGNTGPESYAALVGCVTALAASVRIR